MSLPHKFKDAQLCGKDGSHLVHSVLMAVHSKFISEVLETVPSHVQHVFILPDFSIDELKILCSVMYGSEKTGYVKANLIKTLGFLPQTSVRHISAQPTAAVPIKPGTQVTPDEIKLKAKQMVELVRATQIIQTKRLPPTQSTSSTKAASEIRELKNKKPKKMIRVAGGEVLEDKTLMDRNIKDFRLFCGDLGNDVTDQLLTKTFSKYPSFQMARVIRDKTKGYGSISFKDTGDFTRKKQVSENIQLKQCKICKKTFKSVYHMKRHAENVHESIRKYACDKCQLVFKRKEHLNDHQTVHASERTFRCELCGYSSSWKCDLVHHMKKFH